MAQDEAQRGWKNLEIQAARTMSNVEKDKASVATKMRSADRDDEKLELQKYQTVLDDERERIKLILDDARGKNELENRKSNGGAN